MDPCRITMYNPIMHGVHVQGGWEVLSGASGRPLPDIVPAVRTVIEARRFEHFLPEQEIGVGDVWQLHCHLHRGGRICSRTADWQPREPGAWYLCPPDSRLRQDTRDVKLPLHSIWLRFTGGERLGLQRLFKPQQELLCFRDPANLLLTKTRAMAATWDQRIDDGYWTVMEGLMCIVQLLLDARPINSTTYEVSTITPKLSADPLVQKIRTYLAGHFREKITRAHIARQVHTSVATVERHYNAVMGETIQQTVTRLRIEAVKHGLLEGKSIKLLADETGFCDPFHLSKTFRQHEGMSPTEFLRRRRA